MPLLWPGWDHVGEFFLQPLTGARLCPLLGTNCPRTSERCLVPSHGHTALTGKKHGLKVLRVWEVMPGDVGNAGVLPPPAAAGVADSASGMGMGLLREG